MRRFKLEHKRQRGYKAMLFLFIALVASFVYLDYGRPTGFVANAGQQDAGLIYKALGNEQVQLFVSYHPDYSIALRELDYIELALAKEREPEIYGTLEGRHYEIEFVSGGARIAAILNDDGNIVRVYYPEIGQVE